MVKNKKIWEISLIGGSLCMDFINTVHDRMSDPVADYLLDIHDLVAWAARLDILDTRTTRSLEDVAASNPRKGEQFFKEAVSTRELLYRMFSAISEGKKIRPADMTAFNSRLPPYFSSLRLKQEREFYQEDWNLPAESFYRIIAPVMNDAYGLLLSGNLQRVKSCPSCGWLFLDSTKNGQRRWCSMKSCGSNVKALEWYHRQKEKK